MSTILHRLAAWAEEDPHAVAQIYQGRHESRESKGQKKITAAEFRDRVYWMALFLESKGISSQDIGTILSYNCPEWVHLELATLLLGAKSAGLYPNSTQKDIHYILNQTESRFLAIQNKEYFKKIVQSEEGSPQKTLPERIELLIVFDGDTSFSPKAISYYTALAQGKKLAANKNSKKLKNFLGKLDPDIGAFLIFTSGTTGFPKGAMLSHDNLTYAVDRVVDFWGLKSASENLFSFLPLCHIAEKLQNIGCGISQRYPVYFCSSFDNISKELPQVQPTLLLCVPRLWEKMMEGILKKVGEAQGTKKLLAKWAFEWGEKAATARFSKTQLRLLDWVQWKMADRLVLSKIRKAAGLGRARLVASGAANLSAHVTRWFRVIGIDIVEVFGQTESSGVICITPRGVDAAGTVGVPTPGMEFKLGEDGEVMTRGRHVFKGYYKDPVGTAACITPEGWLLTGDLAEFNERKLLKIKGRKKEILKTSGGKMVAPVPIEEILKAAPIISQVCMVGDGRKYLSALITLREAKLAELKNQNGALSGNVVSVPAVTDEIKGYVEKLNASLATYEQIKRFAVLTREFSIADGEMTPTMKMKRNVIEDRYKVLIDQFYE